MDLKGLFDRAAREPVLFFGAVGLSITAWAPQLIDTDAKKAAMAGIILYLQRVFSSSKKAAEEQLAAAKSDVAEQVATAKYVGAVENHATVLAGRILSRPVRVAAPDPEPPAQEPAAA